MHHQLIFTILAYKSTISQGVAINLTKIVQLILLLTSSRGPKIWLFRTRISLDPIINNKEITTEGLENQLFRSGNSLEAISLEAESTVSRKCLEERFWAVPDEDVVNKNACFSSMVSSIRMILSPLDSKFKVLSLKNIKKINSNLINLTKLL